MKMEQSERERREIFLIPFPSHFILGLAFFHFCRFASKMCGNKSRPWHSNCFTEHKYIYIYIYIYI